MKVDIVKACNVMHGKQNPEKWPGNFRTNLNEYANACYGSCARLHNFQSNSQVLDSKEGKECQRAMFHQLKLNGKTPCENWLPAPVINLPPRVSFFNEIKKGSTPEKVRDKCIRECKNNQECIKNVIFDHLAYISANPPPPPPPPPPPTPPAPTPPLILGKTKHHKKRKKCKHCHSEYRDVYLLIVFSILLIGFFIIFFKNMPIF